MFLKTIRWLTGPSRVLLKIFLIVWFTLADVLLFLDYAMLIGF